jgi:hypothetical protein
MTDLIGRSVALWCASRQWKRIRRDRRLVRHARWALRIAGVDHRLWTVEPLPPLAQVLFPVSPSAAPHTSRYVQVASRGVLT